MITRILLTSYPWLVSFSVTDESDTFWAALRFAFHPKPSRQMAVPVGAPESLPSGFPYLELLRAGILGSSRQGSNTGLPTHKRGDWVTSHHCTSVFPSVNGASCPDFPGLLWRDNQIMYLTHQVRAGTWKPSASTNSSLLCHPATTFLVPILYHSPMDTPFSETEVFAGAETEEPTWALWWNLGPVVSNAALKTKFCQQGRSCVTCPHHKRKK